MAKIGHYGTPALVAAIASLLLLIIHLAVPFGVADYGKDLNDAGQDDESVSLGDIQEQWDLNSEYGLANPGTILAGAIVALIGAVFTVVGSFLPVTVTPARLIGWFAPLMGIIGAFIALASTFYWWGVGFGTLLGLISQNPVEFGYRLWIISPVVSGVLAGVALFAFFKVMVGVVATRDGLRDGAAKQRKLIVYAIILLFATTVMPWSMEVTKGEDRRLAGFCDPNEPCPPTVSWWSAYGDGLPASSQFQSDFGGVLELSRQTADIDGNELFQGLATSIEVLTATAWIGFFAAVLATFGGVLSSIITSKAPAQYFPMINLVNVLMLALAAIFTILAASYQWKPNWDDTAVMGTGLIDDQTWFPSPLAFITVIPVLVIWSIKAIKDLKGVFGTMSARGPKASEGAVHSFD